MTGKTALRIVAGMANAHEDDGNERKAEGVYIGEALQRLARDLGIPNARHQPDRPRSCLRCAVIF